MANADDWAAFNNALEGTMPGGNGESDVVDLVKECVCPQYLHARDIAAQVRRPGPGRAQRFPWGRCRLKVVGE